MTLTPTRRHAAILLLALLPWASLVAKTPATAPAPPADTGGYRLPPDALRAIVDAPRPPQLLLGPKRDIAAMMQVPPLPGIVDVAQPELKLAGLRIHPRTHSASRFSFGTGLWLMDPATGRETPLQGLPQPLSIASVLWSPDQTRLAFNQVDARSGANELWLVDIATKQARRIASGLNTVAGRGYVWMPDSRQLLVQLQPAAQGAAPASDGVPTGPNVQQTGPGGSVRAVRTYQDLLRNEHDARLFEHYLR